MPWRLASSSDPALSARRAYALERCAACGSAWIAGADLAAEPPALYSAGSYAPSSRRLAPLVEPLRRLGDRERLRFVLPLAPGARVFEIGAGDGRLLADLARRGFAVGGSEPSEPYAALCRGAGLDVVEESADAVELEPASVDAVVLWHVLEHLDGPAAVLERAARWLVPGGALVAAVPNLASLQARIGGDVWFHQDVPRHRTHFTPAGLVALVERTGFRVRSVSTRTPDQSMLGMAQTLLSRLTREPNVLLRLVKGRRVAARDAAVAALLGPVVAPVAVAVELAAQAAGRGGAVVVRAESRST